MKRLYRYLTILILSVFLFFPIWFIHLFFRKASNNAIWKEQYSQLPIIELSDDEIKIQNIRDFRYHSDQSIAKASFIKDVFLLSEMQQVWYGISHFGPNGLAHVFIQRLLF